MKKRIMLLPARPARRKRSAFTLVELMIVVLIIGMLMNIAAPAFIHARDNGQAKACVSNLKNISLAREEYALDNNIGANDPRIIDWTMLSNYVHPGTQPQCPTTGQNYVYTPLSSYPSCPYGGPASLPHIFP